MLDMRSYRMIGFFLSERRSAVRPSICRCRLPVSGDVSHVEGVSPYKRERLLPKFS